MTDKFVAMMLEREREAEKLAKANWGHVYITDAADWRAMREWAKEVERRELALALLCADGPAFANPLAAMAAKKIRDEVLARHGVNSDGTKARAQ